jgi:hypothetical protein
MINISNRPTKQTCAKYPIYPIHESGGSIYVQGNEKDKAAVVKGRY